MFERDYDRRDRYVVYVEFIIEAETPEDAETEISNIIMEGILATDNDNESMGPKCEYDITDSQPAEVDV